eukprot:466379_1
MSHSLIDTKGRDKNTGRFIKANNPKEKCNGLSIKYENQIIKRIMDHFHLIRMIGINNKSYSEVYKLHKDGLNYIACSGRERGLVQCSKCSTFENNDSFRLLYKLFASKPFKTICDFIDKYHQTYYTDLDIKYDIQHKSFYLSNIDKCTRNLSKPLFICAYNGKRLSVHKFGHGAVYASKPSTAIVPKTIHQTICKYLGDQVTLCHGFVKPSEITKHNHHNVFQSAHFQGNNVIRHRSCAGVVDTKGSKSDHICGQCRNVR